MIKTDWFGQWLILIIVSISIICITTWDSGCFEIQEGCCLKLLCEFLI